MTIAIADWQRFGRRPGHAADAVRVKLSALESRATRVVHDFSLGSGERYVDHLVISAAGVFTVAVREIDGRDITISRYGMTVDGEAVAYLRQAKFEAEQVARAFDDRLTFEVPVRGCVVLVAGSLAPHIDYESRPIGVSVLTKSDVPRWFHHQPHVLETSEVAALVAIATAA